MKERTIASRVIAACCAIAATFAAAACAFTTRDAVAAPTTDSASGSIAISYQHKSSDSETGDDSTNFAISDASFNLYKVGQIPASGGAACRTSSSSDMFFSSFAVSVQLSHKCSFG